MHNIHKVLHLHGKYTVWEVQLCSPTNISMQENLEHTCWQKPAVTKDVRGF